jgi:PRTRC genetic system protein E
MFFKALSLLLADANLSFIASMKGDIISVTVTPKTKDKNNNLTNTPWTGHGTAEEMDEKFIPELEKALAATSGFFANTVAFVASAKDTESKASKGADTAKTTIAATAPKANAAKEKVTLTAGQKAVVKKGADALAKAKKQTDPDMIAFLKNQTVKQYTDAKMDVESIETLSAQFDGIVPGEVSADKGNAAASGAGELALTPPDDIDENNNEEEDNDEGNGGNEDDDNNEEEIKPEVTKPVSNKAADDDDGDIF